MASVADASGGAAWPVPADPELQPQAGIRRPSSGGLAKRTGTSTLSLRPVAGLEAVCQLAAWLVLFPGDQKHSLPPDPVQPETAARTTRTEGGRPGSKQHENGVISTRNFHCYVPNKTLLALGAPSAGIEG